jgi:integrase
MKKKTMANPTVLSKRDVSIYLETKLRSDSSKNMGRYALNKFDDFVKSILKDDKGNYTDRLIKKFKEQDENYIFDVLQLYINWLGKNDIQPRTVLFYFSALKRYLHYQGIKFHPDDIKLNLVFPKIAEIDKHGLTTDEIKQILDNSKPRKKALYLTQISSGMRIGELVQLRKKDFDLTKARIMIRLPAKITKLKRARITFISKEAAKYVRPILNQIDDNDLVFGVTEKFVDARTNEMKVLSNLLRKLGLDKKDENGNGLISTHSFRAYFITKVSRLDYNLAKLFAGQKGYMLQYDRLSEDEKLDKYIEFERELITDQTEKLKEENQELKAKEIEIENLKEEFKKDHEIVEQLNWVGEFFQYYINKARGKTTQEDDKKFNEKYNKFVKPIPKDESELIHDPEIIKMLDEMTAQMFSSQKVS